MLFTRLLGRPAGPGPAGRLAGARRPWRRGLPRLASLCAVCHGWGDARVCAECVRRFADPAPRCARCALVLPPAPAATAPQRVCGACLTDPPPFDACLTGVDYDHPWDGLIQRFKFQAALDLAPALVERLLAAWRRAGSPPPALLLPVPLGTARLRERGYNQAWELARRLASALDCPADPHLLLRIADRPHQLALAPDQRAANVRGAFAVEPRRRAELQGREVTLVDDVMTTGATAAEAAHVLRQAGAARVHVWAVARTAPPGPR